MRRSGLTTATLGPAVVGVAVGLALAGCASGPRASGPVTPIRPENLFVSPSGEPFRGVPGGAYASAQWFARADGDHDGRVTRPEFLADADRAFRRFDANGDGVIDGLEIAAYEETIAPEIEPRVGALGAGEGMDTSLFGGRGRAPEARADPTRGPKVHAADRELQGAGFYGMLDEPEPLSAADTDLDGKVTRAEWLARSQRRFELLAAGATTLSLAALPRPAMQRLYERDLARRAAAAGHR